MVNHQTTILHVKNLHGCARLVNENKRIAILNIGYADGLPRLLANRLEAPMERLRVQMAVKTRDVDTFRPNSPADLLLTTPGISAARNKALFLASRAMSEAEDETEIRAVLRAHVDALAAETGRQGAEGSLV